MATPSAQVLHNHYADDPDDVVLAMNVHDDKDKMASWWRKSGLTFPSLNDAEQAMRLYCVFVFPSSTLIGPDGKVRQAGGGSALTLEKRHEQALATDQDRGHV